MEKLLSLQSVLFIHFFGVVKLCFGLISVCYFGEADVVMTTMPPFFFRKKSHFFLDIEKKVVSLWC